MQSLHATQPAMAAFAETAKGAIGLHRVACTIHMDHPRLHLPGNPVRARQVLCVDIGAEAIFGVVGECDSLFFTVERRHNEYRTEHFILRNLALGGNVGKYGQRQETASGVLTTQPFAACNDPSSLGDTTFDHAKDARDRAFGNHRAE